MTLTHRNVKKPAKLAKHMAVNLSSIKFEVEPNFETIVRISASEISCFCTTGLPASLKIPDFVNCTNLEERGSRKPAILWACVIPYITAFICDSDWEECFNEVRNNATECSEAGKQSSL